MDSLTLDIVVAVAAAQDEEIEDLPPLAHRFDPVALERFVESSTIPTSIVVEVYGCVVEIDSNGNVAATDATT